jgi:outer membrane protein TolC
MTGRSHIALAVSFVACCAVSARAQTPAIRLTLADAIARAFEASHRLGEARARELGAQASVRVQQATDRPTLGASAGYSRTNQITEFGVPQPDGSFRVIYPNLPDNYRTRLFGQWPIYTGGRSDALERAAAAEARAAGAEVETARADLRLEVIRVYWGVSTANEAVRVLEESVARADAHLRDVRSRFEAGLIPPNDVLSFEAQRSREELQLIEARNLRDAQVIDLRRLTDIGPDTPIELADTLGEAPVAEATGSGPRASDPLVAEALQRRSERQALTFRIQGAEARETAAAAGHLPTISLTGAVDYARPNTRIFPITVDWRTSWDVGVNVLWTFWDSGRTGAEMAEASAAVTAARERLADLDTLVAADVRQRLLDVDSSLAAVRASADGVRSAAEARRVVTERFNVGVATSTEVLDAQVALLQAELDRTRALANVRLAEARLERALGR